MELLNCRICNEKLSERFIFKEMMFGMRDKFTYAKCPNCECIQILEVPADIEKYYPPYYCSFTQHVPVLKRLPLLKRTFNKIRIRRKYKKSNNYALEYLRPINTSLNAKILDIGCGQGALICSFYNLGFKNVAGIDKFITNELDYGNGVKVSKKGLPELDTNTYDLLILHHVLEHMDAQIDELKECYRLLKKGGTLLVVIPVLGTPWELYKENWVQIDAPRHFVLHSLKSIALLAQKTGFAITHTIFDSTAFQFWGSELYQKDIPLTLPDTHQPYPAEKAFTGAKLLKFGEDAKILNAEKRGDAARFYFYKG